MKKFMMMAMVGSLSVSIIGCGGETAVATPEAEAPVVAEETVEEVAEEVATEGAELPTFSVGVVTADGEMELTEESFAGLDVVEKEVLKTSQKGDETNTWTGVDFMSALATLGITEFETVSVEATDGYAQEYTMEIAGKAMLAYAKDGAGLGEDGPINTVVDGESGNMWMKNLSKIVIN
ncbi:MAG: molybdopterin-dependent oxidoreductase [Bacillota bacterium]